MRVQDEEKVNGMVQQWLQERGFVRALQALREESFVEAPEDAAGGQVSCTPACALVHVCRAEWTECARCSLLHDPFRMQLSAIIYEHWEMKQALELGGVKPLDADCREAEEQLLQIQSEKYKQDYCYLAWLCRCYIMNFKPHLAWEIYINMETSNESLNLLSLIANDCYKMGQFYYSVKAFDVLETLDPDPEFWEGKRGASIGVF